MSKVVWVRVKKFCAESGDTDAGVRGKINDGVWPEGILWKKAPDGSIRINTRNYNKWVEGRVYAPLASKQSKSTSGGRTSDAASASVSRPRLVISDTRPDSRRP